jgi:methionine-rich copper-binding protein CopC
MSFKRIAGFAIAASMALGSAAFAHPALKVANPAANGTVSPQLKEIRFSFSEAVVPAFSGAKLTDRTGQVIPTGTPRLDPKNKKELVLPLKQALTEGKYQLAWYAVASDTHRVKGGYAFTVKK